MDAEELDLTIIEATDEYRPGNENGAGNVESHGAEASSRNGTQTAPLGDAERLSLESRIAHLDADVASWQRRAECELEQCVRTPLRHEHGFHLVLDGRVRLYHRTKQLLGVRELSVLPTNLFQQCCEIVASPSSVLAGFLRRPHRHYLSDDLA